MSSVTKSFRWRSFRFGAAYAPRSTEFTEEMYRADCTASGPFLERCGHQVALDWMAAKIGSWIMLNFERALLVQANRSFPSFPPTSGLHVFPLQNQPTPDHVAHYLLNFVCVPLLKGRGLAVHKLALKVGAVAAPVCQRDVPPEELAERHL